MGRLKNVARRLKNVARHIALALAVALLVPMMAPATKVQAAEVISCYTVEMGENAYLEYEETDSVRTAVYYVDGVAVQKSVYDLETGEILCYDLSQNIGNDRSRTFSMRQQNVVEYHIDDFKQTTETADEVNVASTANVASMASSRGINLNENIVFDGGGSSYSFLKSYTYTNDGVTYDRALYGYTDSRRYKEDYWFFEAGVGISTVSTALGIYFPEMVALGVVVSVAGVLVSKLSVTDWIKDSFWEYQFTQYSPEYISFNCSEEFIYLSQRLLTINDADEVVWETIYEKEAWEIEAEQDDILESPGYYY